MKINSIVLVILLAFFAACKTTVVSQEKKMKRKKPKYEDLVGRSAVQNNISPNTIQMEGIITKNISAQTICERKYEKVIEIQVTKVLQSGAGITNFPLSNKKYFFVINKVANDKMITKSKKVSLTVKEGLCQKGGESVYEILKIN
ncbi:hypothetical protein [Tenacibaculum sp. M341]|uniref:hypothetical protein n=2 Tax=Tenacibaculum TaxID=104267 RepID=UPI001049CF01|nr:hypothetical protein [Tenacibaculum sp. M341]TCI93498.1 hypothetical protein EYW44_03580 [Tenacibaculum sp. M341]